AQASASRRSREATSPMMTLSERMPTVQRARRVSIWKCGMPCSAPYTETFHVAPRVIATMLHDSKLRLVVQLMHHDNTSHVVAAPTHRSRRVSRCHVRCPDERWC